MPTRTEIPGLLLMLFRLCQLCSQPLQGEKSLSYVSWLFWWDSAQQTVAVAMGGVWPLKHLTDHREGGLGLFSPCKLSHIVPLFQLLKHMSLKLSQNFYKLL